MSRRRLFEAHPQLERPGVTGGAYWSDGQILDANRLTFECVADAAGHGAVVANHVEATGLMRAGNGVGGVLARDELSGCEIEIPARLTINAAGPWALALLKGIGPTGTVDLGLHWTLNVNLVTARVIDGEEAIGVAGQRESDAVLGSSKRLYFITPWQDCSIIGTGHYPYTGDPDDAGAAATAIDDLLTEVDQALPELGLSRRDLRYVHLGLTPTEDEIKRSKRSLIVDHERLHGIGGLMTVVGIKYTTAPTVAQQVVAAVSKRLDTRLPAGVTFARLLPGAVGWSAAESWNRSRLDSTERATDRAWARRIYGALAEDMLASTDAASSDTLDHVFRCRILYGVRHEMVVRLGDAIFRASDLAERGQLTPARLEWCTGHLAAAHGWSTERRQWEIEAVHERLRRSCSAGW